MQSLRLLICEDEKLIADSISNGKRQISSVK